MQTKLIPLISWVSNNFGSYGAKEQKDCAAESLCVGVSTVYRWLNDGNIFIEEIEAGISGDDGLLQVWKLQKSVL